ncbi:MAG: vitamin K epoxide reductase family protein [Planctomycetota bacterium]
MGRFFIPILTLASSISGVLVTVTLVKDHLAVYSGNVAEGLFCGGAGRFDCNAVAAHASSWLFGYPVAAWGLAYYILITGISLSVVLLRGPDRKAVAALGVVLVAMALVVDAYLAVVMFAQIGHICLNCVATYGINIFLFLLFWISTRGVREPLSWLRVLPSSRSLLGGDDRAYYCSVTKAGILLLALSGVVFSVWVVREPLHQIQTWGEGQIQEFVQQMRKPPNVDLRRFDGQPSIGPADAELTVVLVGDFQCSFCRSLANNVERLRVQSPDRIRVLFVNSPISGLCNPAIGETGHEDACWLAEAAECAHRQGKFWDYHDFLYVQTPHPKVSRATVEAGVAKIGLDVPAFQSCMNAGAGKVDVQSDIALCREIGLTVTPSVVLNGYLKRGSFFPWMLDRVVGDILTRP